ncbi:hypothetical protein PMAYCL1PPCAC_04781, partial [Pristionchus mayeri]
SHHAYFFHILPHHTTRDHDRWIPLRRPICPELLLRISVSSIFGSRSIRKWYYNRGFWIWSLNKDYFFVIVKMMYSYTLLLI